MQTDVVTGAFGYSGAAIARELRAAGRQVRTLTGHPRAGAAGGDIDPRPLDFSDQAALTRDLAGAHTLYCTYWVRFPHGTSTRESAVANSKVLFDAAVRAGVQRIVYVSILHADTASPYPYFSGKGEVERHLAATGVPHAIARPAILFGSSADLGAAASVLLNNIAWLLRRLPVFGIGDGGGYRLRPIHVDDLARLLVDLGGRTGNVTVDAVGPDAPTFREMVNAIRSATGTSSMNTTSSGSHHLATRGVRNSSSSSLVADSPSLRTTAASGRSCQRGCAMPMTAASATAGCAIRWFSSSTELIHSPPDLTRSFVRSDSRMLPCRSIAPTSPVRSQPSEVKDSGDWSTP